MGGRSILYINEVTQQDIAVLQESPFSDMGSVSEIFDNVIIFRDLRRVIDSININAIAA